MKLAPCIEVMRADLATRIRSWADSSDDDVPVASNDVSMSDREQSHSVEPETPCLVVPMQPNAQQSISSDVGRLQPVKLRRVVPETISIATDPETPALSPNQRRSLQ